MEQVGSSHFTDEETEGACLMSLGCYMAVAILLSLRALYFIFLCSLSSSNSTVHTNDYHNSKS